MHIAKLCSDIQHNAESSIIQIIEKHLSKQQHKKLITGTQYIQPTSQNHTSTYTKFQHPPPYQPNTHHTSQYTHRSTPSDNHNPFKHSSTSSLPSPLLTLQTTAHLPYHIQSQPVHKTLTNTIHQPSSTSAPPSFPYSPTLQTHTYQHHTTTTTPFPQHTSQTQQKFQHITAQT